MKRNDDNYSAFKRFVRFLKKNRGSYALVCLFVVVTFLIIKAIDSVNSSTVFKSYLSSIIDLKIFVTIVLVFILTGIASLIGGLFAPKVEDLTMMC